MPSVLARVIGPHGSPTEMRIPCLFGGSFPAQKREFLREEMTETRRFCSFRSRNYRKLPVLFPPKLPHMGEGVVAGSTVRCTPVPTAAGPHQRRARVAGSCQRALLRLSIRITASGPPGPLSGVSEHASGGARRRKAVTKRPEKPLGDAARQGTPRGAPQARPGACPVIVVNYRETLWLVRVGAPLSQPTTVPMYGRGYLALCPILRSSFGMSL